MSNKKHGVLWWLFIGWWMYPSLGCCYIIKGIYFDIPVFIIRTIVKLFTPSKPTDIPAQTVTPPTSTTKKEPYVYVTRGGKKYHYDLACPGIRNVKEIKMDLSKARQAGYTACDVCCFEYLHKQDKAK